MKKILTILCISFFMTACGAPAINYEKGLDQKTGVRLVAASLVGKSLSVNGNSTDISQSSLTTFTMGIVGSKDSDLEGMEVLFMELNQGSHSVVLTDAGVIVLDEEIYLSEGQIRDLRVK